MITPPNKIEMADWAALALDNLPHYAFIKDTQGCYLYANQKYCTLFQGRPFLGKTDFDLFPPQLAKQFHEHDQAVLFEKKEITREELLTFNQRPEWFRTYKKPILNESQELIAILGYVFNITSEKNESERAYVMMKILSSMNHDNKTSFALFDYDVLHEDFIWQYGFYELYEINPSLEQYDNSFSDWANRLHLEDYLPIRQKLEESLANPQILNVTFEFRIRVNVTKIKFIWAKFQIQRNDSGQALRIIGVNLDISETKNKDETLRHLSSRLEMATRAGKIGLWTLNCSTMRLEWDAQMFKLYGIPEEYPSIPREKWIRTLHPYDRQTVLEEVERALHDEESQIFSMTYRIIHPYSLKIHYIFVQAHIERDPNKNPLQIIGVNVDITESKQNQLQLQKLELVNQFAHIGNWELDTLTSELHWDKGMFELYGVNPADFKYTNYEWIQSLNPQFRHEILNEFSAFLNDKHPSLFSTIIHIIRRDNRQKRSMQVYAEAQRDPNGRPIRIIGINIDITEREQERQISVKNEYLLKTLTETSPVGIFRTDIMGNMIFITGAWQQITHIPIYAALNRPWYTHASLLDQEFLQKEWRKLCESDEIMKIECRFESPQKTTPSLHWALIQIVPEYDLHTRDTSLKDLIAEYHLSSRVIGYTGTITDITDRKLAEQSVMELNNTLEKRISTEVARNIKQERLLLQQSKLASMGEMIGNIAHQWRQPLTALSIIIANLKDSYDYDEFDADLLEKTVSQSQQLIQKMSKTIDDFRNFFRPDKEKVLFSLETNMTEILSLMGSGFSNHAIQIHYEQTEKILLWGYPNEFSQAILNILSNAKDALIERKIQNPVIYLRATKMSLDSAMIEIEDNGGGIDPQILLKIFDPYFTTKEKGTGIGLYMTKVIIEQNMSGKITIQCDQNKTYVRIMCPLWQNDSNNKNN